MSADIAPARPVVLTVAGSDSGGGAGIQADLKTFAALGVYGTSAITAVTVQHPGAVSAVQGLEPALVAAQVREVRDHFPLAAAKTGMLLSAEIIAAVAATLAGPGRDGATHSAGRAFPLVVDPVLVSTSGTRLLREDALDALQQRLFPLAALITPNADEAVVLGAPPWTGVEGLEPAARALYGRYGVPVLVKGGHLPASGRATDCLYDGSQARHYSHRWIAGVNTHGTGCTLSAAIAAHLALGRGLPQAVELATGYLLRTLEQAVRAGPWTLLNHGAALE